MIAIQAALNGGRTALETTVPITPEQIASDAHDAIALGAFAVHVHPRDASGRESLEPGDVANVVRAVRGIAPLGVTTGAWIVPDSQKRIDLISRWTELPDFASVNMHEEGAIEVAELLLGRGVGIEVGLSTPDGAKQMMRSGIWKRALRVLIEPQEPKTSAALANVDAITEVIERCDIAWLLHGVGATAWPLIREAGRRRWETRVGFEDTLVLPDGSAAKSNADLFRAARLLLRGKHG